jgi:hypothetical protein
VPHPAGPGLCGRIPSTRHVRHAELPGRRGQRDVGRRRRTQVAAGNNVCVTANVGDVNLSLLSAATDRYVGTYGGGQMGSVDLTGSSRITLRARFRSTTLRSSSFITIDNSIVGGTPSSRVVDQLIYIPCCSDDVTVRDRRSAGPTPTTLGTPGTGSGSMEARLARRIG